MVTIKAKLKKTSDDQPSELLLQLQTALTEERLAIEKMDEEALSKVGAHIEKLLQSLAEALPLRPVEADTSEKALLQKIRSVRRLRDENCRLLEDVFRMTGSAVEKATLGKRVLQAYYLENSKNEVYLKKNC